MKPEVPGLNLLPLAFVLALTASLVAQEAATDGKAAAAELARKLQNPFANLMLLVTQLVSIGQRPVQFGLTGRRYAERPSDGPEWGLSFTATFTFPD